jgi:hypothetical protein
LSRVIPVPLSLTFKTRLRPTRRRLICTWLAPQWRSTLGQRMLKNPEDRYADIRIRAHIFQRRSATTSGLAPSARCRAAAASL